MFLTLMIIGLVGLAAMAIPALGHARGALLSHGAIAHTAHGISHLAAPNARGAFQQLLPADPAQQTRWRFLPSPRALFSVLALYGAFGNAAVHAFHLTPMLAAVLAAFPSLLAEWLLVRPLWNVLFRVQAAACSPLEQLVLSEAQAVVPFRNGRGMVSAVRDGRRVQLAARLRTDQQAFPVKVGDPLLIEEVDAAKERVTVSVLPG